MAAFCACCGAEIRGRDEVCAVCGTPRHGMLPKGLPHSLADNGCPACLEGEAVLVEDDADASGAKGD